MSNNEYEVRILERYCKGCGLCVEECPLDKLFVPSAPNEDGRRVIEVRESPDCSGCLKCATICPDAAIEIYEITDEEGTEDQQ